MRERMTFSTRYWWGQRAWSRPHLRVPAVDVDCSADGAVGHVDGRRVEDAGMSGKRECARCDCRVVESAEGWRQHSNSHISTVDIHNQGASHLEAAYRHPATALGQCIYARAHSFPLLIRIPSVAIHVGFRRARRRCRAAQSHRVQADLW